ncbi:DMT family transporter [Rhodobacteraceae bacterium RKSG542]|uniref:DMT family transporter n=1 Tax=Pseudovibrio flavus TaxID=2529854 RepID=UPI0012BBC75F|nr:DMT family transporter [Pseudovibrio flavus]MTI16038.1 DMT family transporter [Pseudovibrio flavus]
MLKKSPELQGILLACLAFLAFSSSDAMSKQIVSSMHPFMLALIRFLVQMAMVCLVFRVWRDWTAIYTKRPVLQVIRGIALSGVTLGQFLALQHLQLAEAIAILFAMPLIVTALSGPILGEWPGIRRWSAALVGFAGVLVVVQPGTGAMHWAAIYSFMGALSFAVYTLLTRILTATETNESLMFYSALAPAIALAPAGLYYWEAPQDPFIYPLIAGVCLAAMGGHYIFTLAYRLAPAGLLSPFMYTQIIWMIFFGYIFFHDVPTTYTLLGAAIIISSGLYTLYREGIRKKEKKA